MESVARKTEEGEGEGGCQLELAEGGRPLETDGAEVIDR